MQGPLTTGPETTGPESTGPERTGPFATRLTLRSAALAGLLAALVLFPLLGHRPLTDWDEGIYAEISREMLSGSWLTPHWNGQPWFEKPPLEMWLTASSMRLFGLNAWAARLTSALAGVATVGLLHAWLRQRMGTTTAWFGTTVLLSAFGFQHAARVGETDILLGLGCLLGVLGLADISQGSKRAWWMFWLGFAIAVMAKGAASIVLPVTAVLVGGLHRSGHWTGHRRFGGLRGGHFWMGMLVFLAAVLPWHVWMYAHGGRAFLDEYLGYHVLRRGTEIVQGHHTHGWFYLWVLLLSAPPFALFYPWAVAAPFRRPELQGLRSFAVFAMVSLVLFTVARTRVPHYMVPSYPVFSALTGALLSCRYRERAKLGSFPRMLAAGAAIVVYAASALLTARPRHALHSPHFAEGHTTPDNREAVTLLQQTVLETEFIPGPLLVWARGAVIPVTTDAFYARRLAQQVDTGQTSGTEPYDMYYHAPEPLERMLSPGQQRVMLLEKPLAAELPRSYGLVPLATGRTYEVALVRAE